MRQFCSALIIAMGLAAFTPRAEANTSVAFLPGSLIIPASSVYQTDCGAMSMYGLVYDVLRANVWLAANGHSAITIYYAIADSTATAWSATGKQSPNRCKASPASLPFGVPPAQQADPSWNDGCDFQLTGVGPLVKLVDNNAIGAANDTIITTYPTTAKANVWPTYAAETLNAAATVGYMGGPMLIKAADALTFLQLLDGTILARDSANKVIDFSPFLAPKPLATGVCSFGNDNYVNIHRAYVAFTASVAKQFTATPPRLALLDTGGIGNPPKIPLKAPNAGAVEAASPSKIVTWTTTIPHGFAVGDQIIASNVAKSKFNGTHTVLTIISPTKFTAKIGTKNNGSSGNGTVRLKPVADTGTISGGILQNYLNNAGLTFNGAQGCPTGGINVGIPAICPIGGNAGQIYDTFDFQDLVTNKLTVTDAGVPRYTMVWTPHWDTSANAGTPPNAPEVTALSNMKSFLDGQTGLFAECAAVTSYEGTWDGGAPVRIGAIPGSGALQLQTCINSAGSCAGTSNFGFNRNFGGVPSGNLRNCSDITTAVGSGCAYYGYPQDSFAQLADYDFVPLGGETMNWAPNTNTTSMYKPGVFTLISGVASLNPALLTNPTTARAMIVTDWATRNIKDNAPGKANILYLGGHDLTGEVSGTKLVLQTLLQLGSSTVSLPPTTTEVSRASPVVAQLNGAPAIVQGTFESIQPPPLSPPFPPTITGPASVATWSFPAVFGHMRATVSTSIGTGGTTFNDATVSVLFDAASGIPAVTTTGCPTPIDGTCRNVFTTTLVTAGGVTRNPPLMFFNDGNAPTLANLMFPGLVPLANQVMMVDKVLAGVSDGFGGYISRLGGVDRSTVAVIEASSVTGGTRPTMAYFGATDGMLHAVCASVLLPGCDVVGRELWAFIPRTQLPFIATNTARVDGSPHVADVFGDFTNSGIKSFHTILTFQTGAGNATAGSTPAVIGLDITNPTNPSVVWEYTAPSPAGANEIGTGLAMAGGTVNIAGIPTNLAFAESRNGGTGGNGIVVAGINVETGAKVWQFNYSYPALHVLGDLAIPTSGIPGGAVAIDKTLQGFTTDVVFGDLYGNLWEIDPITGVSRYAPGRPLFQYSTDYHPIGSLPAIYSNGSSQFAVVVPGGFADANPSLYPPVVQTVASISLNTPPASPTLTEASGAPNVPFTFPLGPAGEKGFSQALVVGGQLFITGDTTDVNGSGYGTTGATTGSMTAYNIGTAASTTVVVSGGAGSLASTGGVGGNLYTSSGSKQAQIVAPQDGTTGPKVDGAAAPQVSRKLWLQTL